ncbi:MAG: hypothetical protein QMD86_01665 [Patescibacteria group bacterium]|nr:hypothetical protein [Patescibacteria group bacterium]
MAQSKIQIILSNLRQKIIKTPENAFNLIQQPHGFPSILKNEAIKIIKKTLQFNPAYRYQKRYQYNLEEIEMELLELLKTHQQKKKGRYNAIRQS